MDTEDREHFKTIGSAPAAHATGISSGQRTESSSSANGQASCLRAAKVIFACYRKDEAHDPDVYSAAIAAVLSDYPSEVVDITADPRTGIASACKFLPSVAEIKEFCDATAQRKARLERYAALPRAPYRQIPDHAPRTANLFVPNDVARYGKMVARHDAEPGSGSFYETRECSDGVSRSGLWVPLEWWLGATKIDAGAEPDDRPIITVSDALKELIAKQGTERASHVQL